MPEKISDFAFPRTIKALEKYELTDPKRQQSLNYGLPASIDDLLREMLADLPEFLALYWDTDFDKDVTELKKKNPLPADDITTYKRGFAPSVHREFNSETHRERVKKNHKDIREDQVYPLTEDELQTAKHYIQGHEYLTDAIASVQAGIQSYFQHLPKKLAQAGLIRDLRRSEAYRSNALERIIWKFQEEASGFSFIHDLLPAMAYSLARQGEEHIRNAPEFANGQALRESFLKDKDIFRSNAQMEMGPRMTIHCPFGKLATGIFSMQLRKKDDGSLHIEESKKPGSLLASLQRHLKEKNEVNAATYTHDADSAHL